MRRRNLPVLLPAILVPTVLVALSACSADPDGGEGAQESGPTVVVTMYPMQFIAERVVGDAATVTSVAAAGTEPHDLELSPAAVATLTSADVVLMLGEFQAAVDDALTEVSADTTVVDAADSADLLAVEEEGPEEGDHEEDGHDHGGEEADGEGEEADGHDHGGLDPHFWLDPHRVADVADAFAATMAQTDADNASTYEENAARLRTELEDLDTAFHDGLANCEQQAFVTSHEAFGYLAYAFDLEQIGITGIDPEAEPSPAQVAEVLEEARARGVTTVFNEPGGVVAGADEIAAELNVTLATLDPLEFKPTDSDYLGAMTANLAALQEGLVCN